MTRVIYRKMETHAPENGLLTDDYFGFRKEMQLARLTEHISNNVNINKGTGLMLLDLEKTFSTAWQMDLIYKMIHM